MIFARAKKILRSHYPIFLIAGLGLGLRLLMAANRGSLLFDDIFSIHFCALPLKTAIKFWLIETNPPLFSILLRFFLKFINPGSEPALRSLAMFFGIAGIVAIYASANKFFNKKTAIVSALLLALSCVHMLESAGVRTYTLLALLSIISTGLCAKILQGKASRRAIAIFAIVNTLFLHSHLTAISVFLVEIIAIYFYAEPAQKKTILLSQMASFCLFLPWLIPSAFNKLTNHVASGWYFTTGGDTGTLFSLILGGLLPFNSPIYATTILLSLIAVFYYLARRYEAKTDNRVIIFYSAAAFFPLITSSLLGVFVPKYLLAAFPTLFAVIGYSISLWATSANKFKYALIAIFLFLLYPSATLSTTFLFSWQTIAEKIGKYEGTKTLILTSFPESLAVKWYYKGTLPIEDVYMADDSLSEDERIARNNWQSQNTTDEELAKWLEQIIKKYGAERALFVKHMGNYDMLLTSVVQKANWQVRPINIESKAIDDYTLYEFIPASNNCETVKK